MLDLAVIVEGQTEEAFVNRVLAPHLSSFGVETWAVLPGLGARRRGGGWPWSGVRSDAERLLKERRGRRCALMFDYYGLPPGWPGRVGAAAMPPAGRAAAVESALGEDFRACCGERVNPAYFLPHIQLHEFEARLFSDCAVLAGVLGCGPDVFRRIVDECGGPEAIDDDPLTAPSKRLQAIVPRYRKVADGVVLSERIGLPAMRSACPHFGGWLGQLEALVAA